MPGMAILALGSIQPEAVSTEYSAEDQNQYHQTVKQCSTLLESVLLQYPVKMTLKVVAPYVVFK